MQVFFAAGGGAHGATPTGYLSVLDFGAKGNDPGDGSGHEDSSAFQACMDAAVSAHMGVWVPMTGNAYKISTNVFVNHLGGNVLRVEGGGYILCNTVSTACISFANIEQVFVDLNFRGLVSDPLTNPQRVRFADCTRALEFVFCREAYVTAGRFFWLGASDCVLYCGQGSLYVESGVLMEGAAGAIANVRATNWIGIEFCASQINDIGQYQGFFGGNAVGSLPTQAIPQSWILVEDPYAALVGSYSQQTATFRNIYLDEGTAQHIKIAPSTIRINSVSIQDVRCSSRQDPTNVAAFDITKVDNLSMVRSSAKRLHPEAPVAGTDAVLLTSVARAELDACQFGTATTDSNTIHVASDCGVVEMRNMVEGVNYRTLTTAAPVFSTPAIPSLAITSDGVTPWTITPGSGGGLVSSFVVCANGVVTAVTVAASSTGAAVTFPAQPFGPTYTVIAVGPAGESAQSPPGVNLDLDLTTGGTFSRNLVAWYFTSAPNDGSGAGFQATVGPNVRRAVDTRGDGIPASLLMEKAATNYVLQSHTTGVAPWGGGTGSISPANANGIDGTFSAGFADALATNTSMLQTAPGPAGRVCASVWVRGRVAPQNAQITIAGNGFSVAVSAHGLAVTNTAFSRNSTSGVAAVNSGLTVCDGADRTGVGGQTAQPQDLEVDMGQIEAGYYPTSVIVTTGTSVTRPADLLSYPTGQFPAAFLTTGAVVSFAPDASSADIDSSGEVWRLIQNGANDYIEMLGAGAGAVTIRIVCGGVVKGTLSGITFARYQKLVITGKPTAGTIMVSGASAGNGTNTVAGAAWAAAQTLYIGSDNVNTRNVTGRYVASSIVRAT